MDGEVDGGMEKWKRLGWTDEGKDKGMDGDHMEISVGNVDE